MADNYAARKDGRYKIVGIAPDLCFTPGTPTPVPYPVISDLAPSKHTVASVYFNHNPAFVFGSSFSPTTLGDAAGTNKGVVSGTVAGDCWSIEHSPDTFVGGFALNRVNDLYAMNGKAVGGRGGDLTKKEAWERRKALIEKGNKSKDPKVREAAKRLALNNTGIEKARLADYIYEPRDPDKPTPPIPEGWKDISDDDKALKRYGLNAKDLTIGKNSGFRARVYDPDPSVFGSDLHPSLVFRGTRMNHLDDWKNNLQQGAGMESDYYRQAVKLGKQLKIARTQIDVVGHSLGGGLASAASAASGESAWTYNAAGLKDSTVMKYSGHPAVKGAEHNIVAYRVKGEILTGAQEPGFSTKMGMFIAGPAGWAALTMPVAMGFHIDLDGGTGSALSRHDMSQVLRCIELQKEVDEKNIYLAESGE